MLGGCPIRGGSLGLSVGAVSCWGCLEGPTPVAPGPDRAPHPAPPDSFWTRNSFETDSDLPAGWMRVQDTSGTYYWHIPTGTTQWEPPSGLARGSAPGSPGITPSEEPPVSPGQPWGAMGLPHSTCLELAPLFPQLAWTGFAPAERFGEGDFWKVRGEGAVGNRGGSTLRCPAAASPPCSLPRTLRQTRQMMSLECRTRSRRRRAWPRRALGV